MTVVVDLASTYQWVGGLPRRAAAKYSREGPNSPSYSVANAYERQPPRQVVDVWEQRANILRPQNTMDTVQMVKMTGNFYGSKEDKKGLLRQRL